MKQVILHPEAEAEFSAAVAFYRDRSLELAVVFAGEVERALTYVRENPKATTLVRDEIRRRNVRRFPYAVLFREEADRIYVLAIAHDRRRPEYWLHRG